MQLGLPTMGRRIELGKKNAIGQGTGRHHAYPNPTRKGGQYMTTHGLMPRTFEKKCHSIRNRRGHRNLRVNLVSNRFFLSRPYHQRL